MIHAGRQTDRMFKTFKYRLFTNANQERELSIQLETHRRLYNEYLSMRQMAWECCGVSLNYFDACNWLTHQRKSNPHLARLNRHSTVATLRRLDKSFDGFFRRIKAGMKAGYPRFKSQDHFNSITFQTYGFTLTGNRLRVQYAGTIRVKVHRPHEGKIKTVTLIREAGKWYAILCCDLGDSPIPESKNPAIGIDVGLKTFVTTSDNESLGDSRNLERALPELRRHQRALARCKLGSANRKEVRLRLTRCHAKVTNCRRDTHHKVARSLVDRYSVIAAESLNIKGMLRNRRLARRISDAGWGGFIQILTSKAASAGCEVKLVDPKGTSQDCSKCGAVVKKALSVRVHKCDCGCVLDRDHNAALNILARAAPESANEKVASRCSKSRRVKAVAKSQTDTLSNDKFRAVPLRRSSLRGPELFRIVNQGTGESTGKVAYGYNAARRLLRSLAEATA